MQSHFHARPKHKSAARLAAEAAFAPVTSSARYPTAPATPVDVKVVQRKFSSIGGPGVATAAPAGLAPAVAAAASALEALFAAEPRPQAAAAEAGAVETQQASLVAAPASVQEAAHAQNAHAAQPAQPAQPAHYTQDPQSASVAAKSPRVFLLRQPAAPVSDADTSDMPPYDSAHQQSAADVAAEAAARSALLDPAAANRARRLRLRRPRIQPAPVTVIYSAPAREPAAVETLGAEHAAADATADEWRDAELPSAAQWQQLSASLAELDSTFALIDSAIDFQAEDLAFDSDCARLCNDLRQMADKLKALRAL